jgi:hypothetical protein
MNNLVFSESFLESIDLSNTGQNERWFTKAPWGTESGQQTGTYSLLPDGGLRITTRSATSIINHPENAAAWGPEYLFGYFEARLRFSSTSDVKNSWGAFWLMSKPFFEKADGSPGLRRWCELDVFEAAGHNVAVVTVHSWTWPNGGRMVDQKNDNSYHGGLATDPIDGEWHTFGALWQKTKISWYIDNELIATSSSLPICDVQPLIMIVGAQTHSSDSQTTDIAWVHLWQ